MPMNPLFSPECPLHNSEPDHLLRSDIRLVEQASLDLLNQTALAAFLQKKEYDNAAFAEYSPVQQMHILQLSKEGIPTLAAFLYFCPYPQGFFPQLAITASVVPGLEIGDTAGECFLEDKKIEGSLTKMYKEAAAFCEHAGKGLYPTRAMQELILNALIHRDYSPVNEGTPIRILFFRNRLEIHSPGALFGCDTEDLGKASPDLRNPTLAAMAEVLTDAKIRYSGIPRIRTLLKDSGYPDLVFENRENEFVAILYAKQDSASSDETEALLAFCRTPRSRAEIAEFLGVKTVFYVMQHYVQPLIEEGRLSMTLPDKPKSSHQRFMTV